MQPGAAKAQPSPDTPELDKNILCSGYSRARNTQRSVRAYVHAVTRTHRQQHARARRECNVLLPSIRLFYIDWGHD